MDLTVDEGSVNLRHFIRPPTRINFCQRFWRAAKQDDPGREAAESVGWTCAGIPLTNLVQKGLL